MSQTTEAARIAAGVGPGTNPAPPDSGDVLALDKQGRPFDPKKHRQKRDGSPVLMKLKKPGERGELYRLLPRGRSKSDGPRPVPPRRSQVVDPPPQAPGGPVGGPQVVDPQGGGPLGGPRGTADQPPGLIPPPPERALASVAIDYLEVMGRAICAPPGQAGADSFDGSLAPGEKELMSGALEEMFRAHGVTDVPPGVTCLALGGLYFYRCFRTEHGQARWARIRGGGNADDGAREPGDGEDPPRQGGSGQG